MKGTPWTTCGTTLAPPERTRLHNGEAKLQPRALRLANSRELSRQRDHRQKKYSKREVDGLHARRDTLMIAGTTELTETLHGEQNGMQTGCFTRKWLNKVGMLRVYLVETDRNGGTQAI